MKNFKNEMARTWGALALAAVMLWLPSCASDEKFTQQGTTEFFVQDFNPPYLDILWMVDERSPLNRNQSRLLTEAKAFFQRLDGTTSNYRMAFISHDMVYAKGRLKPLSAPVILTKNYGTVAERASLFGNIISQKINLSTGAVNQGFESTLTALKSHFVPRTGVPLVIVFLSDANDNSTTPNGEDPVDYYAQAYLDLKGGKKEMLKIYSVNYEALAAGQVIDSTTRCATEQNADIDKAGFRHKYFEIVDKSVGAKANLCGSFASTIDLTGLRLKELPKRFKLEGNPNLETLIVAVYRNDEEMTGVKWSFDSATNEIVFETAPLEGATIQVTYFAK